MSRWRHATALAVCMLLASCTSVTPSDEAADAAAIAAVNESWGQAYNAGDAAGLVALYAEDGAVNPPGVPQVRGRAAMQEFFSQEIASVKAAGITMTLDPSRDSGSSGDLAWESGSFRATDQSGATVDEGKYLTVLKRTDGKWQIVRDTWNSDRAPAPAPTPSAGN